MVVDGSRACYGVGYVCVWISLRMLVCTLVSLVEVGGVSLRVFRI